MYAAHTASWKCRFFSFSGRPETTLRISLLLISLLSSPTFSAPWIEAGNETTRHHLQTLIDTGAIRSTVTAWPLMWSHIKQELDDVDTAALNDAQLWSYQYLRHELRKAMKTTSFSQRTSLGNAATAVGDFSSDHRERYESGVQLNYTGDKTSFNLQALYAHDPHDDESLRFDGSYLSRLWGNWALGVGAVDRWWGPGWESSLILSHNARPTPGLFLQRNASTPFETPLLSWLGPWQLVTFMSQLENDRDYSAARLWGMRVNFKPLRTLDIGLSRTAIWGGDGRPGDLDTFAKLLIGKDNRGGDGINEEGSNEPGNQLAGIDLRWSYHYAAFAGSVYGQLIGEDEAGGMPSRHIGVAGIEMQTLWHEIHMRFSLEAQNTTVYFYDSAKKSGNVAYEHSIYNSGYRYYQRPIGASSDNDTEAYTLRSQLYFQTGDRLILSVGKFNLNEDASNAEPPGGSVFRGSPTRVNKFAATYARPLNDVLMMELSIFHYSEPLFYTGEDIDSGAYISLRAHW